MEKILAVFGITDAPLETELCSGGHIHGTYQVRTRRGSYIVQHMNPQVFPHPETVMENIAKVTAHIRTHYPAQTTLHFYRTTDGGWLRNGWRLMDCIPGKPLQTAPDAKSIAAAGRAFGAFQQMLTGLDPSGLQEVLPGLHDTPAHFAALRQAVSSDPLGRRRPAQEIITRLLALEPAACALAGQGLPVRIIHGDTKLSNILFDDAGQPLAVIDLDTVSPGLAAYDYGDAVRSLHTGRGRLDKAILRDFTRGFLEGAVHLTDQERETLPMGITCITAELAARYLTDHLTGDSYFHTPDSAARAAGLLQLAEGSAL